MSDLWITVPNWDRYQNYSNPNPDWIRNWTSLLHNPDYLALTGHQRGVLHGLWLAYASSHAQLPLSSRSLSSQLSLRVFSPQLEALNQAGFIEFSASPSRARARQDKKFATTSQTEQSGAADATLPDNKHQNHLVNRLLTEIRDANSRTATVLHRFEQSLPDAAFAAALESLRSRRQQSGKPPLHSEARYVVAALATMQRERQYQ